MRLIPGKGPVRTGLLAGLYSAMTLLAPGGAAAEGIGTRNHDELGTILVDDRGYALYTWTRDEPGVTNYVGTNWPRVSTAGLPAAPVGVPGAFGATTLADGTLQVTYNGWPLYTYVQDTAPGQVAGQGAGGGTWWVVNPAVPNFDEMMAVPARTALWRENTELGTVLVDQNGWTLYTYSRDEPASATAPATAR